MRTASANTEGSCGRGGSEDVGRGGRGSRARVAEEETDSVLKAGPNLNSV